MSAAEGRLAREALEQHAAEREDVGARVDVLPAPGLLWRHVRGGPDEGACPREPRGLGEPGDAEVEQLHARGVAVHQEQVARLEIAVDDAARVDRRERGGGAHRERDRLVHGEHLALEPLLEILAIEPLHGEPRRARGAEPVRDVAHDTWARQLCEHPGLAR